MTAIATHKMDVEVAVREHIGMDMVASAATKQHAEPDIRDSVAIYDDST